MLESTNPCNAPAPNHELFHVGLRAIMKNQQMMQQPKPLHHMLLQRKLWAGLRTHVITHQLQEPFLDYVRTQPAPTPNAPTTTTTTTTSTPGGRSEVNQVRPARRPAPKPSRLAIETTPAHLKLSEVVADVTKTSCESVMQVDCDPVPAALPIVDNIELVTMPCCTSSPSSDTMTCFPVNTAPPQPSTTTIVFKMVGMRTPVLHGMSSVLLAKALGRKLASCPSWSIQPSPSRSKKNSPAKRKRLHYLSDLNVLSSAPCPKRIACS